MQSAPDPTPEAQAAYCSAVAAAESADSLEAWRVALQALQHAADLGSAQAQAALAALAGDWQGAQAIAAGTHYPTAVWEDRAGGVDLAAALAAPQPRILSASPRIALVEAIAAPELCDWLIARAAPKLGPARVYDPDSGGARKEQVRSNSECHLSGEDGDFLLAVLRARMAMAAELPVGAMEATAILHYTVGQEFLPHFDFLDSDEAALEAQVVERGQRVLTFLVCLNDDYEGGETEFPALGKRWKGRKGNALFFWNVEPNGAPDHRTLHAGLPPTRGEKWLLSQWIRSRSL